LGSKQPEARLLSFPDKDILLSAGIDPAALPILIPKLESRAVLIKDVKLFAANILKQSMLSVGGDVAVHRFAVSGKCEYSDCIVMGDIRHYKALVEKLETQPYMQFLSDLIRKTVFYEKDESLKLKLCSRTVRFDKRPVIMGIVNITPDSFSDGGEYIDHSRAVEHALELIEHGASIIDIGGESSRPGACPVDEKTEIQRIVPVIRDIAKKNDVVISVDTTKAVVAKAAIDAGAVMINDISAMTHDAMMLNTLKKSGAGIVLMHMRGKPQSMQAQTHYDDVVSEIYSYLKARIDTCLDAGIDQMSIVVDPGIGFGKDFKGNLRLIKHISEFSSLGVPVMLGYSKKSFIGSITGADVNNRLEETDAVTAWAVLRDVDIIRVHDVRRSKKTIETIGAILKSK
jgi:dihydropteroate synthase